MSGYDNLKKTIRATEMTLAAIRAADRIYISAQRIIHSQVKTVPLPVYHAYSSAATIRQAMRDWLLRSEFEMLPAQEQIDACREMFAYEHEIVRLYRQWGLIDN